MSIYVLKNNRVPTKKWLDTTEEFRKYLSLPFDTKVVKADSKKTADMVGLVEIINAFSQTGYNLNHAFTLQKEDSPVVEMDIE